MVCLDSLRDFVESGRYYKFGLNTKQLGFLRDKIKAHQSKVGARRMEWAEQGVVGIFEGYRIFEDDMEGLKVFLSEIGLLPILCEVEWSVLSQEEQEQMKQWMVFQPTLVRFTANKDQKCDNDMLHEYEDKVSKLEITKLVDLWLSKKMENDLLVEQWKTIKHSLNKQLPAPNTYHFDFGTVSCSNSDPLVSGVNLYKQLGKDIVMKYGQVDMSRLPAYMARGFISKCDLKKFRKVIDIRLKYTLMQIVAEQRRREYYQKHIGKLLMQPLN